MKYEIVYGSLKYNESITEEIFNDLIASAEAQGLHFYKHWPGGSKTYEAFKTSKYLNFDIKGETYEQRPCYIIDNNSQQIPPITLQDLERVDQVINNYEIY